jgi:hypothetical protein
MKRIFHSLLIVSSFLAVPVFASMNMADRKLSPDTVVLTDGTELHGLIIKNNATEVVLQERMGEQIIPKSHIRRIEDQGNAQVYFADIVDVNKLPPWRMIVQDLRTDDNIKTFEQIPPTTMLHGGLHNIPYLSFRINKHVEMNVYGNPEDPVCLEFGIYEKGEKITQFKKLIREYLAGTLESRAEIAALYALKESGDERKVGKLCFRISPPTSPDAYGGWWISVYDPDRLEKARISDAAYLKQTLPFTEVNTSSGKLRDDRNMNHQKFLDETMMNWSMLTPDLRGFYRDKMGDLKLLLSKDTGTKTP